MKTIYKTLVLITVSIIITTSVKAQLNPLSSQYYTNQYLINPAFAGAGEGLKLNGAYRKLLSNVPGSPLTQNLTVDYGFNKVGLGLMVNNESAGLQRQTRVVGSYGYHLKLNDNNHQLHFGLSLGFMSQRLENADIYGKKGYDNSWEGILNGAPLAEGTYYYIIDFGTSRPRFRGFITITRPE